MPHLSLDHMQRLNLIALLDALEVKGIREIFAVYKLQESLDLDAGEKKSIEFVEKTVNGQPQSSWNPEKRVAPRDFEVAADDYERIRRAVESWQGPVSPGQMRAWLKPLWTQIEANGANGAEEVHHGELEPVTVAAAKKVNQGYERSK